MNRLREAGREGPRCRGEEDGSDLRRGKQSVRAMLGATVHARCWLNDGRLHIKKESR